MSRSPYHALDALEAAESVASLIAWDPPKGIHAIFSATPLPTMPGMFAVYATLSVAEGPAVVHRLGTVADEATDAVLEESCRQLLEVARQTHERRRRIGERPGIN